MAGRMTLAQIDSPSSDEEPLGKRARSKLEKRARILNAAREIFAEKGFAAATTQEIAERAGVAAGTLFLYAATKEELLIAAFVGAISEVAAKAESSLPAEAPVLDQLMHVFAALVAYHRELGAGLSAVLLKELMYGPGPDWTQGDRGAMRIDEMLVEIVERGRSRRELRAGLDVPQITDMLFSIFHWQLSHWALGRVASEDLEDRLRYRFGACLKGLAR
jgi:AcrR family transcriptional regulator